MNFSSLSKQELLSLVALRRDTIRELRDELFEVEDELNQIYDEISKRN